MAWEVEWAESAWDDLSKVADFIATDSPYYAAAFINDVCDAAESLSEFAERGRTVPEFTNNNIRELFIINYRMIYEIQNQKVVILTFIHGAKKLKPSRQGKLL